jgi:AraC-like DNA-binding protein
MAKSALLSRFYFARVFRDATGVTPGRFLAAVRIYQAKRMLQSTSMSITDISLAVGYNSLGSFTNYFTQSVSVSPSRFRHMSRMEGFEMPAPRRNPPSAYGAVTGTISVPPGHAGVRVYLGAFMTPILQHRPATAVTADLAGGRPSGYCLPDVPEGRWFIHAVGVADGPEPWGRGTLLVGRHNPVTVTAGAVSRAAVRLRPRRPTDPPILLALPHLERQAC